MAMDENKLNLNASNKSVKYLVPLDGSGMAESVIPVVESLAKSCGATVILLHVIEKKAPATVHGERHLTEEAEAGRYLEGISAILRSSGVAVENHVHANKEGDVAASIVQHAEEMNPDLVIMCTHGRGGLKGFLYGSIAQQALQKGTWPILLVPPSAEGKKAAFRPARILVPLDGTHRHEPALAQAFPIANAYKAEMYLVMVIPTAARLSGEGSVPAKFMPRTMKVVLDLAEQGANDYLRQIAGECQSERVNVVASVLRGDAVPRVLDHAAEIAADLIVMASHGKSGLNAFLSGSTAARIAGKAARPLLLVRTSDMEESR